MKLSITSAFHYILFALVLLMTPARMPDVCELKAHVKAEKSRQIATIANEKTDEVLHSEILFRY